MDRRTSDETFFIVLGYFFLRVFEDRMTVELLSLPPPFLQALPCHRRGFSIKLNPPPPDVGFSPLLSTPSYVFTPFGYLA